MSDVEHAAADAATYFKALLAQGVEREDARQLTQSWISAQAISAAHRAVNPGPKPRFTQ